MELYNALRWLQWLPSKIAKLWSLKRKSNAVLYVPTDIAAFSAQTPAAAWQDETVQTNPHHLKKLDILHRHYIYSTACVINI